MDTIVCPSGSSEKQALRFITINGDEERDGTSYLNRKEAQEVERLVKSLLNAGVRPEAIGVVTFYDAQVQLLHSQLSGLGNITIGTAETMQGSERPVIIISCVRKNADHDLGFTDDENVSRHLLYKS